MRPLFRKGELLLNTVNGQIPLYCVQMQFTQHHHDFLGLNMPNKLVYSIMYNRVMAISSAT